MSRWASRHSSIEFYQNRLWPPLISLGRLSLLLVIALLLTFLLATGNVTAERLFQSPPSPPAPPPTQEPAPPQPEPAQPAPEQPATEQPAPEQPAPAQPSTEQPPTQQPAPQTPALQPVSPLTMPPGQEPLPEESVIPVGAGKDSSASVDEAEAPGLALDRAELIDTIIVSGAYIWFCCGIILIPLIPLTLLFLYIRGRRKIIEEEDF